MASWKSSDSLRFTRESNRTLTVLMTNNLCLDHFTKSLPHGFTHCEAGHLLPSSFNRGDNETAVVFSKCPLFTGFAELAFFINVSTLFYFCFLRSDRYNCAYEEYSE
jgi:hypothetical protein